MPSSSPKTWWLDAKWLVIIAAIAAFAVVLGYDQRLGIATGIFLVATGFVWQLVALWFGAGSGAKPSPVRALSQRYQQQQRQRLLAEQRAREVAAPGHAGPRSGPQQAAD
ncbi:MAG: hypothetical protein ACJLS3_07985 [Erythrobacter sp.]